MVSVASVDGTVSDFDGLEKWGLASDDLEQGDLHELLAEVRSFLSASTYEL